VFRCPSHTASEFGGPDTSRRTATTTNIDQILESKQPQYCPWTAHYSRVGTKLAANEIE
jgi:hypothetical protein